jgi:hypothetical protein
MPGSHDPAASTPAERALLADSLGIDGLALVHAAPITLHHLRLWLTAGATAVRNMIVDAWPRQRQHVGSTGASATMTTLGKGKLQSSPAR